MLSTSSSSYSSSIEVVVRAVGSVHKHAVKMYPHFSRKACCRRQHNTTLRCDVRFVMDCDERMQVDRRVEVS
jgi:hypothetical protein